VKVLVLGATGQIGRALLDAVPDGMTAKGVARAELDISDGAAVAACIAAQRPNVVLNVAAYTAVDRAESEPEAAERVNSAGALHVANATREYGSRLIHVSTDFVFDGRTSTPYRPDDATNPLSVYGRTKRSGEVAVLQAQPERALVLRTSWVYSVMGSNFVRTMLRLMRERNAVRVVADQIGTPTSAASAAAAIWKIAAGGSGMRGIYHFSDAGVASWYDFAVAIAEEGASRGLVPRGVSVTPIATHEYPTPARRPAFSVLDKSALTQALAMTPVHWRENLRHVLTELSHA
jgi:dTDP-4-dehydrorhamnose reductase